MHLLVYFCCKRALLLHALVAGAAGSAGSMVHHTEVRVSKLDSEQCLCCIMPHSMELLRY